MIDKFIAALATEIINPLIILMFSVALIVFIWGLVVFIRHGDDPEEIAKARNHIIYGLIGFFLMICAYSIIALITGTLKIDTTQSIDKIKQ